MTTLGQRGPKFDNGRQARPVIERIRDNCDIDMTTGCWLWLGHCDIWGYGKTVVGSRRDGTRKSTRCHIATWEALNGSKPLGMQLDHFKCDRPRCANPQHVRLATARENTLRSNGVTAKNARKTECPTCGSRLTPRSHRPEHRYCRPCYLNYLRAYNARRNGRSALDDWD